jgi:hypothetical protein
LCKLKFPFEQGVMGLDMCWWWWVCRCSHAWPTATAVEIQCPIRLSAHGNRVRDAIVGFFNQRQGGSDDEAWWWVPLQYVRLQHFSFPPIWALFMYVLLTEHTRTHVPRALRSH